MYLRKIFVVTFFCFFNRLNIFSNVVDVVPEQQLEEINYLLDTNLEAPITNTDSIVNNTNNINNISHTDSTDSISSTILLNIFP